jgi:hypothetical protein
MGPILQYIVGVPFGLFCLFGGVIWASAAFRNKCEKDEHNGFLCGVIGLGGSVFGGAILWAILIHGLDFSGPGRYGL